MLFKQQKPKFSQFWRLKCHCSQMLVEDFVQTSLSTDQEEGPISPDHHEGPTLMTLSKLTHSTQRPYLQNPSLWTWGLKYKVEGTHFVPQHLTFLSVRESVVAVQEAEILTNAFLRYQWPQSWSVLWWYAGNSVGLILCQYQYLAS